MCSSTGLLYRYAGLIFSMIFSTSAALNLGSGTAFLGAAAVSTSLSLLELDVSLESKQEKSYNHSIVESIHIYNRVFGLI